MPSKKEKLLKETYEKFIQISISGLSMEGMEEFIDPKIMGYGTTVDEKVLTITEYRKLVIRQREQGKGIKMTFDTTPILHRIIANGNSAIFIDEMMISMIIDNETHQILLRVSTVLEYMENSWIVVHWHGSKPEYAEGETDTWHINEWKNKTEELERMVAVKTADLESKNHELEIEAALERVRAVAMGMEKSENLLNICEISFKEFQKLGFDNLRNAVIHIPNDEQKYFMDYDFSEFVGGGVTKIEYGSHPIVDEYLKKIRSKDDAYFEVVINEDQLEGWKDFRKNSGQLDDPRLDEATALYYYLFSIGIGDIGISTFKPITSSQIKILKRFRNVFNLAYRRYKDIAHAEMQAREAQIETSLERVRAKSMAMHKSEELADLSLELVKQVQALGVATWFCAFNIYDDDPQGSLEWGSNGKGTFPKYRTPREGIFLRYYEAGQRGETFLINEIGANECPAHYNYLCTLPGVGEQLLKMKDSGIPFPTSQTDHVAYFKYGYILFITYEPVLDAHDIFKRFAKVFEQTYTRFLDLKKAEAQAREVQIELSLERIRAQAMAMKESFDLLDIVVTMRSEFVALKHEAHYFWHMRWKPEIYEKAMTSGDGTRVGMVMDLPRGFHENPAMIEWEKNDEPVAVFPYDADGAIDYVDKMIKTGDFHKIDHNAPGPDDIREIGGITFIMARTTHGEIGYSLPGVVTDPPAEDLATLARFAGAFDLAYRRFEDLKEAEAQTREAQIEAALERVRSKAMAMHSSEDLALTIEHFFQELKNLNVKPIRCGVGIKDGNSRLVDVTVTSATENGEDIKLTGKLSLGGHPILDKVYDALQKQAEYFPVLHGEEINEYYQAMNPEIEFPNFSKDDVQYGYYFHYEEGGIFAWTEKELLEEEINIFRRFKSVLSLTYRRYLDIKEAEAQAREAQIEAALEKVRARTMAMQKSDELPEAANLLFQQVQALGMPAWSAGYAIWDEDKKGITNWMSSEGVIQPPFKAPLTEDPTFMHFREAFLRGETFYVDEVGGEELVEHYKYMRTLPVVGEILDKIIDAGFPLPTFQINHQALFSQGFLLFITYEPVPDAWDIFKRFAKVFDQTYTRFLDLKNAEEQNKIIQVENERKTEELEEARELQLSMLPKELPQIPNLEIAVYMQTATEVGGDYYDFHLEDDGTLTAVIGDATGHGLKAGTIVTITKSLFHSLADGGDILSSFSEISRVIKGMNFRQLSMCLIMMEIKDDTLAISSAAMPPVLIYRKKEKSVEELSFQGMPLGAMSNFPYQLKETNLQSGDTIFLFSDGLPELMNDKKEMYDYDRTKSEFLSVGEKDAEEIVNHFKNSASDWVDGNDPDDDVTFVVIKIR